MRRVLIILWFCLLIPPALAAEVRVGILAYRGTERAEQEWLSTLSHLNASLPEYQFVAIPLDIPNLSSAVARREVDFVITNPGHYVEMESRHHITRIATVESRPGPSPSAAIGSAVLVRADRADLTGLADLRGKRIAAVSADAFGGFRVVWRELQHLGIDPFTQAKPLFLGFPMERIADAVSSGQADAGILRICLFEKLVAEGHVDAKDFRLLAATPMPGSHCVASSRLYPDWPFARLASTAPDLAKQVGIALLAMPLANGHGWTVPVDYQAVHELFRDLKVGPYEHLSHRSFAELVQAYWPWLMLAGLAIVWWLIHVARVEYLVRTRTDELRQAHEAARRQRDELEHGARLALVGEMASAMAHEINQPLAAITNYARGCQRRLADGSDPEGVAEGVGLIATQAERAADIIRRMRAFVRKRVPEPQLLHVNDVGREALGLFQAISNRAGVSVETDLAASDPVVVADRVQIEQVLLNLLKNAADAQTDRPHRHIRLSTVLGTEGVEIRIADNGPGLSDEAQAHLFEPFFTTKNEGLGLGLSLSRTIVEAHGGRLWAENQPQGGALFHVLLPNVPGDNP